MKDNRNGAKLELCRFYTTCLFLLLVGHGISIAQVKTERNLLIAELKGQPVQTYISDVQRWKNYKKDQVLDLLNTSSESKKEAWLRAADESMKYNWPALKADDFLGFIKNTSRYDYKDVFNHRREHLSRLVMGELLQTKGKYLPQIVNGIWAIVEESTWVSPRHIGLQKGGKTLPDPNEIVIDLSAGETAALLSYIHLLFKGELDEISPMLDKRILYELDRRIIDPYLTRNDFWWMGFTDHLVNNWTVWINTNVLKTALFTIEEPSLRNSLIHKVMKSFDQFINYYPEDGGCEEGPSYWSHAGGQLIQLIALLSEVSDKKLNWADNKFIHEIGTYIYKAHIDSTKFVNFADAAAKTIPIPERVYLYGDYFDDTKMRQFAAYLNEVRGGAKDYDTFNNTIEALFIQKELEGVSARPLYQKESWLYDLQVLTLRSKSGSPKGLFFAAQGGHNAESHNHNDVGNFILYKDATPVIVDAGVATYTRDSFNQNRYKIWNMQSQWHNTPTINGYMQHEGANYRADQVSYKKQSGLNILSMDLAGAYETEASVDKWVRQFEFDARSNQLRLTEEYRFSKWKEPFKLHFLTSSEIRTVRDGEIEFFDSGRKLMSMRFEAGLFDLEQDVQLLEDIKLKTTWGAKLTRITLVQKGQALQGKHTVLFSGK